MPPIESTYKSQSVEVNDTIRYQNWSFNVGLLVSHDTLYGQGLKDGQQTASGYALSTGTIYKMYEHPGHEDAPAAPRRHVGVQRRTTPSTPATRGTTPAASSLPRAASWARNLAVTINAFFDQNGVLYAVAPNASSTGKLFQPNMTPRTTQEFLFGTSKQINPTLTARAYGRYRYSNHFWEDTNNNARQVYGMPAGWAKNDLYIYNLADQCVGLGCSASSYVIADLDRAYTKYYEATVGGRVPEPQGLRAGLLHLQQVLTATSTRTTRRPGRRTTPTSSSARRTSVTAQDASCGTSRKAVSTAIGPTP